MKFCTLQVSVVLLALAIGFGYKIYLDMSASLPLPDLDMDAYWGPGPKTEHTPSTKVHPFVVQYSKAPGKPIEKLRRILNQTLLLQPPLEDVGFEYGVNADGLLDIVATWLDDYLPRWQERERFLNELPQFTTEIQGSVTLTSFFLKLC